MKKLNLLSIIAIALSTVSIGVSVMNMVNTEKNIESQKIYNENTTAVISSQDLEIKRMKSMSELERKRVAILETLMEGQVKFNELVYEILK